MSRHNRRANLTKTLSKDEIHKVLDRFGEEQTTVVPVMANVDSEQGGYIEGDLQQAKFYADKNVHSKIQDEWDQFFKCGSIAEKLKFGALDGNIGTKLFRSVCWRVFWECLSEQEEHWAAEVKVRRQEYTDIRKKYVIDPYDHKQDIDLTKHHPLSLAEDSIWNKYFQDNELRFTIMQDIDRLCPEVEFFKKESVKSVILHVLFCYAREYPQVSYKQGMHEMLATLVYVMMVNSLAVKECTEDLSETVKTVLDITFIEHDVYCLFKNIMQVIEPWFTNVTQNHQHQQKQKVPNDRRMFQKPHENHLITALSKKLNRIQGYMLKRYDSALSEHLQKIDITPQLYGIRWIRLLFGREFSLNRLLILWDALFADGLTSDLVDYIFLAMLINLRGVLLQNDFNSCLTYLMKYPANTDTKYILKRAIALKVSKPNYDPNHTQGLHSPSHGRHSKPHRPVHPVRNRLGETKEQMYAHALGSGNVPSHLGSKHSGSFSAAKSQFYTDGPVDSSRVESNTGARSEFSEIRPVEKTKGTVASQISSLKTKVGSPTQIINRISNPIRTTLHRNRGEELDVNALAEDHARLQMQISGLQSEFDQLQSLYLYCGGKMDHYLNLLQGRLLKEEQFSDEIGILCLTGLKQIRDIFKNGMGFASSTQEYDVDFNDIDRHIVTAAGHASPKPPEVESSLEVSPDSVPVPYRADFNHFEAEKDTWNRTNTMGELLSTSDDMGTVETRQSIDADSSFSAGGNKTIFSGTSAMNASNNDGTNQTPRQTQEALFSPLEAGDVREKLRKASFFSKETHKGELDIVTGTSEVVENLSLCESSTDPLSAFLVDT